MKEKAVKTKTKLRKKMQMAQVSQMEVFQFLDDRTQVFPKATLEQVESLNANVDRTWVNVSSMADVVLLKRIGKHFAVHSLAQEDILHIHQRPKVEEYSNNLFLVSRMAQWNPKLAELKTEQIAFVLGENHILTFQEDADDCFAELRQQLTSKGLSGKNIDFLLYQMLDHIIDSYFPILEGWGEEIDEIQEEIISGQSNKQSLQRIFRIKRNLLSLRKVLWPQREALSEILRSKSRFIASDTLLFFRDCYDHVIHLIDYIENEREVVSSLVDLHLSQTGLKMNEVMKVLTVISTIFIPLTFIVGVYGMNFNTSSPLNMPELNWKYGYLGVWAVMILMTLALMRFFYKKGWLSS